MAQLQLFNLRSKRFCGVREQIIRLSFLALAPYSSRAKHQKSRSSSFLLPANSTETLATQANSSSNITQNREFV